MTADRNGSKLSPTRSSAMLAVTSAWTAAVPEWVGLLWRSAARASASSGSSPSTCSHRGWSTSSHDLECGETHWMKRTRWRWTWTLEGQTKMMSPLSEVHLVLSIHLSPSSTLQKNIGGGACRPQWNKWEIICWIGGYRVDYEDKSSKRLSIQTTYLSVFHWWFKWLIKYLFFYFFDAWMLRTGGFILHLLYFIINLFISYT